MELKRNRCNWRNEHDGVYCEKAKAAACKRAIPANQMEDKHKQLMTDLLDLMSKQ